MEHYSFASVVLVGGSKMDGQEYISVYYLLISILVIADEVEDVVAFFAISIFLKMQSKLRFSKFGKRSYSGVQRDRTACLWGKVPFLCPLTLQCRGAQSGGGKLMTLM